MSARHDPNAARPRYTGPRDSRTGEVLPPVGWERETGIAASLFDSEAFLQSNGYQPERSAKKAAARRADKKS